MMHILNKNYYFLKQFSFIALIALIACSHEKNMEKLIKFPANSWSRFDILKFELQVTSNDKSYDIIFKLRSVKDFTYEEIPFNMVLKSPSGEERIKEYVLIVKDKSGSYTGTFEGDTCITTLVLKRSLYCQKKGVLKVEIENLNPRLQTEGVFSAALILIQR